MTNHTLQHPPPRRTRVAALLAQAVAWRAQGEAIVAQLEDLARDDDAGTAGEWITLDDARALTGVRRSKGADPHRALKGWLRARQIEVSRVGRALVVRRPSLDAALSAGLRRLRPASAPKAPTVEQQSGASALHAAGLRLVPPGASK